MNKFECIPMSFQFQAILLRQNLPRTNHEGQTTRGKREMEFHPTNSTMRNIAKIRGVRSLSFARKTNAVLIHSVPSFSENSLAVKDFSERRFSSRDNTTTRYSITLTPLARSCCVGSGEEISISRSVRLLPLSLRPWHEEPYLRIFFFYQWVPQGSKQQRDCLVDDTRVQLASTIKFPPSTRNRYLLHIILRAW